MAKPIVSEPSRTAIYMRVSTKRQDNRSQSVEVFRWLKAQGWSWRDARWFRDRGVRSDLLSRPAFDRMMEAVRLGELDRIVVYKMDRIGRWDSDDFLLWRIATKRAGVEIVSLTETSTGFDTLADKIIALVIAEADRLWLQGHRKRVASGIRARLAGGKTWGPKGRVTDAAWRQAAERIHSGTSRASDEIRLLGVEQTYGFRRLKAERERLAAV